ncbi:MAG: 30S ribosomal protein S12 methylthiotransferase RimO [Dissulfurispiraceae bacterium]|jgi:ribosomal protein S12 methylthiotransferase
MSSVYLTTLGCPKNMVDSRHLLESFMAEGVASVEDPQDSDIILVNTCGFIKDAKEESIGEILKLVRYKSRSSNKSRQLLVFGCLAQRYRDELMKEIPEIDGLWGVGQEKEIIEYCKNINLSVGTRPLVATIKQTASFAYLKIAEGCDKKCTFCVIPSIRGQFRSTAHESILQEARAHVSGGVKELILVAQDILRYGKEWKDYGLLDLLRDLVAIEGDFWIRLLYLYPTEITNELLDFIAGEQNICKYLDIPLQHSEDRVLRLMGRRGTRKEYTKLIRTIRRKIPGVTLRTTFIVGFPSETEEDFRGLVDFIEEMRFDRLGVFTFSKEEGTPSAKLKEQVPEKVKKRRFDEIMSRQAAISLEKNKELVGKRFRAIVDEIDGDVVIARLCSHTPEIDGVVIIEEQKKRVTIGEFVDVEIIDAYDYDLKGSLL